MNKTAMIDAAHQAALKYKSELLGKSFLYVYGSNYFEVVFIKDKFLHLTGIGTKVYAKDFFKKILNNTFKKSEIHFSSLHPKDLCEKKLSQLTSLPLITKSDILIYEEFKTDSIIYKLSLSNLNITVCLNEFRDVKGNVLKNKYYPQSFRVGDELDKAGHIFSVDFIFEKDYLENTYHKIKFGDKNKIANLSPEIQALLYLD